MDEPTIKRLLEAVQRGDLGVEQALRSLRKLPFEDLGFARLDHHRSVRLGFPEVIFGQGKTVEQLAVLVAAQIEVGSGVLVTRLEPDSAAVLLARLAPAELEYRETARCLLYLPGPQRVIRGQGPIAVVTAGTGDIPVAEEAAVTAEAMGNEVVRLYDVGVAGIHRLLAHRDLLEQAFVIVAVAGMEGALPSVIAGLVGRPVIAVPTSVGYGASFQGIAPLLAMLNTCAAGVTVVNIDNGFGAGYVAALINRRPEGMPGMTVTGGS